MIKNFKILGFVTSCLPNMAYPAMYCESEDPTRTQLQICSIFRAVEMGSGCSSFTDPVGQSVCLALQDLVRGGNCTGESFESTSKEYNISTAIACHEIYYGMRETSCDHSIQEMSRSLGLHYELDRYMAPSSRKALCMLGRSISKNRMVFTELRKNAILMASIEPLIQRVFSATPAVSKTPRYMKEVRNLSSHVLKRIDELKIGKNNSFFDRKLTHIHWIQFFRDLVTVVDKSSDAWIAKSVASKKPVRFDSGTSFAGDLLPAGIIVFPDGRIIVVFDRMKHRGQKKRPLQSIGEGGYKRVYLAFDFKKSIQEASDGFNDPSTLVGGYIKSHNKEVDPKLSKLPGQSWDEDLFQEIQEEVRFQERWGGQEGIAKKGELVSLSGQTEMREKLVVLEPYYPMDLHHFRKFLSNPDLESINGMTRERVILKLATNLVTGLSLLHKNGINHRDIKPDNILVDGGKDGNYEGFIADFGLALDLNKTDNISKDNKIAGTLVYMSPEYLKQGAQVEEIAKKKLELERGDLAKKQLDPEALELAMKKLEQQAGDLGRKANQNLKNDVWAMGLTLWYLNTGSLRFAQAEQSGNNLLQGSAPEVDYKYLEKNYGIKFDLLKIQFEKSLKAVIYRMLNPKEEERISSQEALALLQKVAYVQPYSAIDYLAEVKILKPTGPSTGKVVQAKDGNQPVPTEDKEFIREVISLKKDSLHRFKKELSKHKYE